MNEVQASAISAYDEMNAAHRPVWRATPWGPIVVGVVSAIGAQFVFTVLGFAVGISAVDTAAAAEAPASVGFAAGAWWFVTGLISLALGGMVLGRLWAWPVRLDLMLHAFALWSVVALFGFLVVWSGAGMATNAASPLAMVASRTQNLTPVAGAEAPSAAEVEAYAERARKAAQGAAWWTLIAFLAGIGATLGGAAVTAPSHASAAHVRKAARDGTDRSGVLATS